MVLALVYLAVGSTITAVVMYCLLESVGMRVAQRWSERYLTAVMRQDIGWFDVGNQSGSLLSAMTVDTRAVAKGVGIQVGLFVMHAVECVGGLVLAFAWAGYWDVALICLAGVPFMAVASGIMLASNEKDAYDIINRLDIDYVLVLSGGVARYASDDIAKFLWDQVRRRAAAREIALRG